MDWQCQIRKHNISGNDQEMLRKRWCGSEIVEPSQLLSSSIRL